MANVSITAYGTYVVSQPLTQGTNIEFLNDGANDGVLIFANGGIGVDTVTVNGTLSTSGYWGGTVTNFQPPSYGVGGDFVTIQQIATLFSELDVASTAAADNAAFANFVTFAGESAVLVTLVNGTVGVFPGYPNTLDTNETNIIDQMAETVFGTAANHATLVLQFSDARINPNSNKPYIDGVFWSESPINPCFVAGTRILTPRGEVAVETLQAGDTVITRAGEEVAIVWVGRRRVSLAGLKRPEVVRPIIIEPGALDEGVPASRLVLSPDHALFIDGVLVQAKSLVNWSSIRPDESATSVAYYHLELPRHDVIIAEGAAVESFLDTGHRGVFDNAEDRVIALPAAMQEKREAESCARLVTEGPELDAIRAALARRLVGIALNQRGIL
jgi:hypothetical protein